MTKAELLKIAKPILFNTEMVKAIMDGRKTVTRRICKDGNDYCKPLNDFIDNEERTYAVQNYGDKEHTNYVSLCERKMPICEGDYLYVRETYFCEDCAADCVGRTDGNECPFNRVGDKCYGYKTQYIDSTAIIKWHPSIHMPKEAARIFLKVIGVRVERLQDITEEQVKAEGANNKSAFIELWDSTIPRHPNKFKRYLYFWEDNPWVWVYEFERVDVD